MENNNIDKIFKDALIEHEFYPHENMWNKIEQQLPTKSKLVWFSFTNLSIAAAVFGAIIALGLLFFFQNKNNNPITIAKNTEVKNSNSSSVISNKNDNGNSNSIDNNSINKNESIVEAKHNVAQTINSKSSKNSMDVAQLKNAKNEVVNIDLVHANHPVVMAADNALALALLSKIKNPFGSSGETEFNRNIHKKISNDIFIDELLRRQLYFVKGIHVGVVGEFGNAWITASVPNSSNSTVKMRYAFNGYLAYGLSAGYDFNNKYGLQIEYHTINQNAQLSEVSGNINLQNSKLAMRYTHVPILLKMKWHPLRGVERKPIVMNILMGIQYGRLTSNTAPNIDYTLIPNEQTINKAVYLNEWNAVAGVSYDVYFSPYFFCSFGGRATFGGNMRKYSAADIAATTSRNLNLGLELGLHYKISTDSYK